MSIGNAEAWKSETGGLLIEVILAFAVASIAIMALVQIGQTEQRAVAQAYTASRTETVIRNRLALLEAGVLAANEPDDAMQAPGLKLEESLTRLTGEIAGQTLFQIEWLVTETDGRAKRQRRFSMLRILPTLTRGAAGNADR